jgi:hypothetical protein
MVDGWSAQEETALSRFSLDNSTRVIPVPYSQPSCSRDQKVFYKAAFGTQARIGDMTYFWIGWGRPPTSQNSSSCTSFGPVSFLVELLIPACLSSTQCLELCGWFGQSLVQ